MCGGRLIMSDIETVLRYTELLNLYQNLLSPTQKEILDDYYSYNLSISEIAENRNISRSAVEDAIKKGKRKLEEFDKKLSGLKVIELLDSIKSQTNDKDILAKIDEIERIMKHGI